VCWDLAAAYRHVNIRAANNDYFRTPSRLGIHCLSLSQNFFELHFAKF
jgi:hypothetical protein